MLSPVRRRSLLATQASTSVALTVVGSLTVLAGRAADVGEPADPLRGPRPRCAAEVAPGRLLTPALLVVLLAGVAAAFVLVGTDVALVASLNEVGRPQDVGWMVALWAGGSVIGGLVYGTRAPRAVAARARRVLALATVPAAFAAGRPWLALAVVVAGLPCAPALSSINSTLVPARAGAAPRRGHGLERDDVDRRQRARRARVRRRDRPCRTPGAGFLTAAVVGGGIAVGGLVALRVHAPHGREPVGAAAQVVIRPVEPTELPSSARLSYADDRRHSVRHVMCVCAAAGGRGTRPGARSGARPLTVLGQTTEPVNFSPGPVAGRVGERRRLAERELQRAQAVTQRPGVLVADVRARTP